jgi:AraC-like DNA-binding protein
MSLEAGACQIVRNPDRCSDLNPDLLAFYVVQSGAIQINQDGRTTTLRPGDATLCVGDRPFSLLATQTHRVLAFKVDRKFMTVPASLENSTAFNLSHLSPIGASVSHLIQNIWSQLPKLDSTDARRLIRNLVDLTETTVGLGSRDTLDRTDIAREANLRRIRHFVECNIGRSDLTPSLIAAHLKLSSRYINKILNSEGTSLARYIWHLRVQEAARRLADPRRVRQTVSIIAYGLGFKSLSHFSDLFRRTFGLSPTEYRSLHR